ncbi:MAG: DUF4340 domain-containing protein [Verrucomicrobia bacterium]|nr:DUF4340 domain-containing protein [Verrucomicrobiota bacterium]
MNRKQLTLLSVLVVVLGGLGLLLYNRQSASWQASGGPLGQKLVPDFPMNDIAQITITQTTTNLNLVKQDDLWRVKERWNYPANFSEVSDLLRKMWELKVVQAPKVGPSQYGRLELLTPDKGTNSGTLLDFKDKGGKTLQTVLLGKKYVRSGESSSQFGSGDWPVGRYVLVQSSEPTVAVVSDPLSDVEPKPDRWLNKDFFKVEKLRSISVVSTNATNSWKLARDTEGGDLKLADKNEGEEFETSKASSVGYALSSPSFNDIVSPETKPEETGLAQPLVATLETFDNFTYTVKVGGKTGDDNYHLQVSVKADINQQRTPGKDEKPEDKEKLDKEFQEKVTKQEDKLKQEQAYEKWAYLVSKWTIDPLLKDRKDFFAEKKEEKKEEKPEEKKDETAAPKPEEKKPIIFDGITPTTNPPPPLPEAKKEEKPTEAPKVDKDAPKPPAPETKKEDK